MSNRALTWAFSLANLPAGEKFVLVVLADFADEAASCYPSQARIAAMTGHGVSTVARHLKSLEDRGLLTRTARRKGGHRTSDRFVLRMATTQYEGLNPTAQTEDSNPSNRENQPLNLEEEPLVREPPEREPPESVSTAVATVPKFAPEVDALCTLLADLIEDNGARRPAVTDKWRHAVRLMVERDERTYGQIERAMRWAQGNDFWRGNILSMPKLREKYDQLRLQALRETTSSRAEGFYAVAQRAAETGGATRTTIEGLL